MEYYHTLLHALEEHLQDLEKKEQEVFTICHLGVQACKETLEEMRVEILTRGFRSQELEIGFFKTIKPKITSNIVYYINRNQIESKNLFEGTKLYRRFILGRLAELEDYFKEHAEFYEYWLRGLSHRDIEFFTRQQFPYSMHHDGMGAIVDTHFSTSHEMVLAKFLGNNRTIDLLQRKLREEHSVPVENKEEANPSSLQWTGAKIYLIELIYALHSSGLVNNGEADLKELARSVEGMFGSELGDIYRAYLELRNRKSNPTKFLDLLKASLMNKMMEADG